MPHTLFYVVLAKNLDYQNFNCYQKIFSFSIVKKFNRKIFEENYKSDYFRIDFDSAWRIF